MKKTVLLLSMFLCLAVGCATTGNGIKTNAASSAKIEKVDFQPDKKGNYYVFVTMRNVSAQDRPFYLMVQADDQVSQFTASGKKGQPDPVPAGKTYTFEVNTWKKEKPQRVTIEVMESMR